MRGEIGEHVDDSEQPVSPEVARVLVLHHRQFLDFLEKRVGSRSDADDILQAALVKSIEKAETIKNQENVVAWFYRVLRNAVTDHYRRRAARQAFGGRLAVETEEAEWPELHQAVCQCVRGLLDTLKPEYGTLLQRVEIDEGTVADTARELGITSNNAAVRLHRARQALRARVMQTCGSCAEHGCLDCHCKAKA